MEPLKSMLEDTKDAIDRTLSLLPALALGMGLLTGCLKPTWKSDGMLEIMQSPFYGAIVDYLEYRPLTVEHVEGKATPLPSPPPGETVVGDLR